MMILLATRSQTRGAIATLSGTTSMEPLVHPLPLLALLLQERERRRLSGARERVKRHEAEGGSFRGLQDRAQAEEIGKAMNYSPRKGIAFDMFPKNDKTSE